MTRCRLRISPELSLPTDFATKSTAILAQRRKGKSYTLAVLAEECVAAEIPFVILDPTGAHWGLRSSADGRREGLPVYVFGGEHPSDPELKLERTAGKEIARFVVDFPGYYVIDFKGFDSKEAERQFATDFAETLYRYKGQPGKDFVMHLFVDEADLFVPQQSPSGDKRMLGAFESIVRRGGIRGLGTTLVSQRAAVVKNNYLEQIDILVTLRTVGPNDREAVRKYVVANGTPDEVDALMSSIASLELGEAWIYEPGGEPPLFARVRIRERRTYNSSATPKPGEKRVEPKALADVEIAALRERMATSYEKAKAEDPKELMKRIRELERELKETARSFESRPADTREVEVVVEVPTAPKGLVDALSDIAKRLEVIGSDASVLGDDVSRILSNVRAVATIDVRERSSSATSAVEIPQRMKQRVTAQASTRRDSDSSTSSEGGKQEPVRLGPGERATLIAVAQYPDDGCSPEQLTILTGYKRSSRNTYIQRLGAAGYVERRGDRVFATDAGCDALGDDYQPLPTGAALRAYWLDKLKGGEREILRAVMDVHPNGLNGDELDDFTGYTRSSRNTFIQRLGARGLVRRDDGLVIASHMLFEEAR